VPTVQCTLASLLTGVVTVAPLKLGEIVCGDAACLRPPEINAGGAHKS